eukprot:s1333_g20.t1
MCLASAVPPSPMPNRKPSKESDPGSSTEESVSVDDSSSGETSEAEGAVPLPKTAPPPEPPSPPPGAEWDDGRGRDRDHDRGRDLVRSHGKGHGKDRSKGPRSDKCNFCWKRVKGGEAAMGQHTWWNEHCLTWQFHRAGHSWDDAKRMAAATKTHRMADESSSPGRAPAEIPRSRPACKKIEACGYYSVPFVYK